MNEKTLTLKPKRETPTVRRHPWIFSGAVASVSGDPAAGDIVAVLDSAGNRLGHAFFSPSSQITARMLSFGPGPRPGPEEIAARVAAAIGRRAEFFAHGATDAVRLVNAESDGIPGLVADCYAGWISVQFSSAGADALKKTVVEALMQYAPGAKGVWERSDIDVRAYEGLPPATGPLAGDEPPELVEISENGIRFLVDVRKGHKTGFYLDQRDARAAVGALGCNRDVLNCFSYTGGFGLACRAAGAVSVRHVDMSQAALDLARKNTDLMEGCYCASEYVCADVFKYLRRLRDEGRTFDLITLDPPKFADSRGGVMKAARGYKDINLLAMKLLRPDGILATFSCSGAVSEELFLKIAAEAAQDARRDFQITGRTSAPADHPVALSFPEGRYLKGLILRMA